MSNTPRNNLIVFFEVLVYSPDLVNIIGHLWMMRPPELVSIPFSINTSARLIQTISGSSLSVYSSYSSIQAQSLIYYSTVNSVPITFPVRLLKSTSKHFFAFLFETYMTLSENSSFVRFNPSFSTRSKPLSYSPFQLSSPIFQCSVHTNLIL